MNLGVVRYGVVGLSTEEAREQLGTSNVTNYLTRFGTLETAVNYREDIPIPRSSSFTGRNLYSRNHALVKHIKT